MRKKQWMISTLCLLLNTLICSKSFSIEILSCLSCTAGTFSFISAVPQVIENCRNESSEGVALSQSGADAVNNIAIIGIDIVSGVSWHATIAPLISVVGDIAILAQAYYYDNGRCVWHEWGEHAELVTERCRHVCEKCAPTQNVMNREQEPLFKSPTSTKPPSSPTFTKSP